MSCSAAPEPKGRLSLLLKPTSLDSRVLFPSPHLNGRPEGLPRTKHVELFAETDRQIRSRKISGKILLKCETIKITGGGTCRESARASLYSPEARRLPLKKKRNSVVGGDGPIRCVCVVDHGGDAGIEACGRNLEELFERAAEGFTRLLTDPRKIRRRLVKEIRVDGGKTEDLLVQWLSELLYQFETQGLLFKRFKILSIGQGRLEAVAEGEPFDEGRHTIRSLVKAPTYHGLRVEQRQSLWRARIVFDL